MNQPHDVIHRFSFVDGPVRGQWVRLTDVLEVLNLSDIFQSLSQK